MHKWEIQGCSSLIPILSENTLTKGHLGMIGLILVHNSRLQAIIAGASR